MQTTILSLSADLLAHLINVYLPNITIPLLQRTCKRLKRVTDTKMRLLTTSIPTTDEVLRYVQTMFECASYARCVFYCPPINGLECIIGCYVDKETTFSHAFVANTVLLRNRDVFTQQKNVVHQLPPIRHSLYYKLSELVGMNAFPDPCLLLKTMLFRKKNMPREEESRYRELALAYYTKMLRPFLSKVLKLSISPVDLILCNAREYVRRLPDNAPEFVRAEYKQNTNILTLLLGWISAYIGETTHLLRRYEEHSAYDIVDTMVRCLDGPESVIEAIRNVTHVDNNFPTHKQILTWLLSRLSSDEDTRFAILEYSQIPSLVVEIEITKKVAMYRCYHISSDEIKMRIVPLEFTIEEMLRSRYVPGLLDSFSHKQVLLFHGDTIRHSKYSQFIQGFIATSYNVVFGTSSERVARNPALHLEVKRLFTKFLPDKIHHVQLLRLLALCWISSDSKQERTIPFSCRVDMQRQLVRACGIFDSVENIQEPIEDPIE